MTGHRICGITRGRFEEISKELERYPCKRETELYYQDWCKLFFIVFTREDESEIERLVLDIAQIPGVEHVQQDRPGQLR